MCEQRCRGSDAPLFSIMANECSTSQFETELACVSKATHIVPDPPRVSNDKQ